MPSCAPTCRRPGCAARSPARGRARPGSRPSRRRCRRRAVRARGRSDPRPLDHGLRAQRPRPGGCAAGFDIDDDGVLEVDQIVGGVGEEGGPFRRQSSCAAGSTVDTNFGFTGGGAPGGLVERVQILPDRRVSANACQSTVSDASAERCLLASALMRRVVPLQANMWSRECFSGLIHIKAMFLCPRAYHAVRRPLVCDRAVD